MIAQLHLDQLLNAVGSRWSLAAIVLAGWLIVLLTLKRIAEALVRRAARRPHLAHLGPIIDALAPAISIVIVVGGFEVAAQTAPIPQVWRADVAIVMTGGFVAALVVFADRIAQLWLRRESARHQLFTEGYGIVKGAVRGLIIALGLLMFLESVGISIGPLLASLGIGSLAIALALQETVRNMFSGFFLIADKPMQVGDYVKLQSGQEGQLFELGWRSSKFRLLTSEVVVVPNSQLIDSIVTNYRALDGDIAVAIDLAVLNSNDPAHVERVAKEVARNVMESFDHGDRGYDPQVLFQGFSANLLNLTVLMHVQTTQSLGAMRNEYIKQVLARFAREEIKLPS